MVRNGLKQTISVSGRLMLLQMVLELDTGRCARGVDCKIPHRLERGTKHSLQGCGNLSLAYAF